MAELAVGCGVSCCFVGCIGVFSFGVAKCITKLEMRKIKKIQKRSSIQVNKQTLKRLLDELNACIRLDDQWQRDGKCGSVWSSEINELQKKIKIVEKIIEKKTTTN